MSVYFLLLFAHVMLFAYWLGSDVGVFYGMRFVLDSRLSIETRRTVMALVHWIDAIPRICLVLMVPVGLSLSIILGLLDVPEQSQSLFLAALWVIGLFWLYLVVRIYGGAKSWLPRTDYVIRVSTMLGFFVAGVSSLAGKGPFLAGNEWLAMKAILFAGVIGCGLMLRILGRPFGAALAQILDGRSTPEVEARLRETMVQSKRVVLVLWALVACIAFLGLTKF